MNEQLEINKLRERIAMLTDEVSGLVTRFKYLEGRVAKLEIKQTERDTYTLKTQMNAEYGKDAQAAFANKLKVHGKHNFVPSLTYDHCMVCGTNTGNQILHYIQHTCKPVFYMEHTKGQYVNTDGWVCEYCKRSMKPFTDTVSGLQHQYSTTAGPWRASKTQSGWLFHHGSLMSAWDTPDKKVEELTKEKAEAIAEWLNIGEREGRW